MFQSAKSGSERSQLDVTISVILLKGKGSLPTRMPRKDELMIRPSCRKGTQFTITEGQASPILTNLQGNICSSILCFKVNVSLL